MLNMRLEIFKLIKWIEQENFWKNGKILEKKIGKKIWKSKEPENWMI